MQDLLSHSYWGNTVFDYLMFLIGLVAGSAAVRIAWLLLSKRLGVRAEKTGSAADSALLKGIGKYLRPIAYLTVFDLSAKLLTLSPAITGLLDTAVLALAAVLGGLFASSLLTFVFSRYWARKGQDADNEPAVKWISGIAKFLVWTLALILFLDNTGAEINSLIAGLGIGGVALAFAAQSILADIFCYFTIFLDKPFEVGDFIVAGQQMGTVERIGIKTTRLRSLNGEQLIFSNTDLTGSRISNYKTMRQRRVLFTLGVTYDTPADTLREIPGLIRSIVESVPDTSFGRAHFAAYAAYSLNFEVAYYVLSPNYDLYMDIHQQINLRIKEQFDRRGIVFAFPTQTLHLEPPIRPDAN